MHNLTSRNLYNPDYFYSAASEHLSGCPLDDVQAWKAHPCTKALIETLRGDMSGIVTFWMNGAFAKESIDESAQEQAKLMGRIQTADEILIHIETIVQRRNGENIDDNPTGTHNPY